MKNLEPEYIKMLESIPLKKREMWLSGNWKATCDVVDNNGKHCPEPAVVFFEENGKKYQLCNRCKKHYDACGFGRRKLNDGHYSSQQP